MATESNFYNRETELNEIWKNLQKGKNLLLRAPRRYGKSSLLNRIFKNPLAKWRICNVDLQGGRSSEDFVELLLNGLIQNKDFNVCLPNHLAGLGIWNKTESNKLEIVRTEREKIRRSWKEYAESLFASIDSGSEDYRSLLILDEVSFLLEDIIGTKGHNKDEVDGLMAWFYKARKKAEKISFILSGSEHLPTFLKSFGIEGHLDDLEPVNLNLFDQQVAKEFIFLTLAGKKIVVRSAEIDRILTLIGEPIPYFLQLFLDTLSITCREGRSLSMVDIESAYYRELLGSKSKRYFEPIELQLDRYNRYDARNRSGAKSILDELAVNDSVNRKDLEAIWQNATNNNQFEVMFSIIKDDFYIREEDNGKVIFASKLLKDWWVMHCLTGKR